MKQYEVIVKQTITFCFDIEAEDELEAQGLAELIPGQDWDDWLVDSEYAIEEVNEV